MFQHDGVWSKSWNYAPLTTPNPQTPGKRVEQEFSERASFGGELRTGVVVGWEQFAPVRHTKRYMFNRNRVVVKSRESEHKGGGTGRRSPVRGR